MLNQQHSDHNLIQKSAKKKNQQFFPTSLLSTVVWHLLNKALVFGCPYYREIRVKKIRKRDGTDRRGGG